MEKKPIQMKSSQSSNPDPPNPEIVPQFVCAVYFDKEGQFQFSYNLTGNFPKADVLPGLSMVAQHFKLNVLDHLQPNEDNDKLLDILKEIAASDDIKASPEMEKVLTIPLPTETDE